MNSVSMRARRRDTSRYTTTTRALLLQIVITNLLLRSSVITSALQLSDSSLLTNTRWNVLLDIGLQPGTWMPKRYPGWAESGARLAIDVDIEFSPEPCVTGERLVGPKGETGVLKVCTERRGPSTFVSEKGEQTVTFAEGGWCIQRPEREIYNADGGRVKPEGLLRFWLDCPSGATRRDTKIFPGTRIFFTTGVWDDPAGLVSQEENYKKTLTEIQDMADRTRESRSKEKKGLNPIKDALEFRKLVGDAKEFERLKIRKEALEKSSPPKNALSSPNGVKIAPTGSLVIKGNKTPDWLPGSEYLIFGTFSSKPVDN